MSIIFGIREAEGVPISKVELLALAQTTDRYAPDGTSTFVTDSIGMGFQPFYTTERARFEQLITRDICGNILVFDGRLDNYEDLQNKLSINSTAISDQALILELFARWGRDIFSDLVGDWALALWSAANKVLYLARDHAGTRTLFYSDTYGRLVWGTYLETFVTDRSTPTVDEDYVTRFLRSQSSDNLTPYKGIRAVPAGHCLSIRPNNAITATRLWDCTVKETLRYPTDQEYKEQFLYYFARAVERRTGSGTSITAHLSGGMDSTSIVCMSDHLRTSSNADVELLDILSYYDDTEPNWNERPYFTLVEAKRGKSGTHVDARQQVFVAGVSGRAK